jgi:hypothetical protein
MNVTRIAVAVLGASTLVVAGGAGATNLIVNGDFSTPNNGGSYSVTPSIPGWISNTSDGIEVGGSALYGLPCVNAACQNLEVNANTFGSVSQTVTGLTVGASYDLAYLYGGRSDGGPQILDVSFGGAPVTSNTGSFSVFTPNNFRLVANATSETLTFASEVTAGSPSYGNEVTNVSLSAVPEPASWALMLIGVAGLGAVTRRRAKAALAA